MGRPAAQNLLSNGYFDKWSGGFPTVWQRTSVTATTFVQLSRYDAPDHPERAVFAAEGRMGGSAQDYIWSGGEFGLRLRFSSAYVANDLILNQPDTGAVGVVVDPLERMALRFVARASVDNNAIRFRIQVLTAAHVPGNTVGIIPESGTFNPLGGNNMILSGNSINLDIPLKRYWKRIAVPFRVPAVGNNIHAKSLRISVIGGTAGAWDLDVGEVSLEATGDRRY